MPTWGMHIDIANKLTNKLKILVNETQKNEFIFANILPDINNGYVVDGIKNILLHKETHFELVEFKGKYGEKPGYINFYEKYKDMIHNPIVLGTYIHLITDFYFNNLTYTVYAKIDEDSDNVKLKINTGDVINTSKRECRKMKQNDFKLFAYYLYKNTKMQIPQYSDKIVKDIKNNVNEFKITDEDVKKTINYIENCVKEPEKILENLNDKNYRIYTQEEMKKRTNSCIKFITQDLSKHEII